MGWFNRLKKSARNATVTLSRPLGYIDAFIVLSVYCDGRRVGKLAAGQTLTFEAPPGERVLLMREMLGDPLRIDACEPMRLNLRAGEKRGFQVNYVGQITTYLFPILTWFSKDRRQKFWKRFAFERTF